VRQEYLKSRLTISGAGIERCEGVLVQGSLGENAPSLQHNIVQFPHSSSPLRAVRRAHHPDPELAKGGKIEMGVNGFHPCDLSRRSLEGVDGSDPGYFKRQRLLPQGTPDVAKVMAGKQPVHRSFSEGGPSHSQATSQSKTWKTPHPEKIEKQLSTGSTE
jgi:hypothetical protein